MLVHWVYDVRAGDSKLKLLDFGLAATFCEGVPLREVIGGAPYIAAAGSGTHCGGEAGCHQGEGPEQVGV